MVTLTAALGNCSVWGSQGAGGHCCLLSQMKDYCTDDKACRHSLLLDYFGERFAGGRCGNACDNCIARGSETPQLDSVWQVVTHGSGLERDRTPYSALHINLHELLNVIWLAAAGGETLLCEK